MSHTYQEALYEISESCHTRILSRNLVVSDTYVEYVERTPHDAMWLKIHAALPNDFEIKVANILNNTLDDDTRQNDFKDIDTTLQGVYYAQVPGTVNKGYVGCAAGALGLRQRIINQHMKDSYRKAESHKLFYIECSKLGDMSQVHWLKMGAFPNHEEHNLVLWLEGIMMILLNTTGTLDFMISRPKWLTSRSQETRLNMQDPWRGGVSTGIAAAGGHRLRHKNTDKMRAIGSPWNVLKYEVAAKGNKKATESYFFSVFSMHIGIPVAIGKSWYSNDANAMTYVKFDITDKPVHPHKWARSASKGQPGARLGIKIYKTKELDESTSAWLDRWRETGVKYANTIVDLIEGRILEKDFDFDAPESKNHKFIFRSSLNKRDQESMERVVDKESKDPATEKRKRQAAPWEWTNEAAFKAIPMSQRKLIKDPKFLVEKKEVERDRLLALGREKALEDVASMDDGSERKKPRTT